MSQPPRRVPPLKAAPHAAKDYWGARMRGVGLSSRDIDSMTTDELTSLLAELIAAVNDGTVSPAQANAITRAAGKKLAAMEAALRTAKAARAIDRSTSR